MPSARAFQSPSIISFIILINMSISDDNKSLDKSILWVLKCVQVQAMVTAQTCVYTVATEWTYVRAVCTVSSYVCSVCTGRTVLLVIVNVLVDTSAQIKVTKGPERGQIELSKLLAQHFCCSNNCMSMDGQDVSMDGQYGGHFKRR